MLLDIFTLAENRFGVAGSVQGHELAQSNVASHPVESKKSKVKVFPSIMDALRHGSYGQIFSTIGSNRLYVITKQKWGSSPDQRVGDKVAKGFSPGSIPSDFSRIKQYAVRTLAKYGNSKSNSRPSLQDRDTGE